MKTKYWIIIGIVAVVGIAIWYVFFRKDVEEFKGGGSGYVAGRRINYPRSPINYPRSASGSGSTQKTVCGCDCVGGGVATATTGPCPCQDGCEQMWKDVL